MACDLIRCRVSLQSDLLPGMKVDRIVDGYTEDQIIDRAKTLASLAVKKYMMKNTDREPGSLTLTLLICSLVVIDLKILEVS